MVFHLAVRRSSAVRSTRQPAFPHDSLKRMKPVRTLLTGSPVELPGWLSAGLMVLLLLGLVFLAVVWIVLLTPVP